jgi:hypothetical protein
MDRVMTEQIEIRLTWRGFLSRAMLPVLVVGVLALLAFVGYDLINLEHNPTKIYIGRHAISRRAFEEFLLLLPPWMRPVPFLTLCLGIIYFFGRTALMHVYCLLCARPAAMLNDDGISGWGIHGEYVVPWTDVTAVTVWRKRRLFRVGPFSIGVFGNGKGHWRSIPPKISINSDETDAIPTDIMRFVRGKRPDLMDGISQE